MYYNFDNVLMFDNGYGMNLNDWLNDKANEFDCHDEWWLNDLDEDLYLDAA